MIHSLFRMWQFRLNLQEVIVSLGPYIWIAFLSSINWKSVLRHKTIWRVLQKLQVTRLQQLLCGLHHHAARSQLATDYLFGSLKQHLPDRRLHSNEEVEMAVRDWLRITRDGFLPRSKVSTNAKMWQTRQWARVQCRKVIVLQGNKWAV